MNKREKVFLTNKYILVLLCFCIFLSGCASAEKTQFIKIPTSFYEYSGTNVEDEVVAYQELGKDYVTSVELYGDELILEVTDEQKENLIKRNDDWKIELLKDFLEINEKFSYENSENYDSMSFYFDENMTDEEIYTTLKTIKVTIVCCIMNNILYNNDENWSIKVSIYNCHNGNLVTQAIVPDEDLNFGEKEWVESYNEKDNLFL